MSSEGQKTNNRIYQGLAILLLISNIVFIYLYSQEKENYQIAIEDTGILERQKTEVEAELEGMFDQYEAMKTNNDTLNARLTEQQTKIQELIKESKSKGWTIYKLRQETATLRDIMQDYVRTIDSLNTANIELTAKNTQITEDLGKERSKTNSLTKENVKLSEKVKIGEQLQASDMFAGALRKKSNNTTRETDRAKRSDMLKCCLTLDENELTPKGKKWVYARIIAPDGKVVVLEENEDNMFMYDGVKALYSVKKQVDYQGAETDVCLYWDVEDPEALLEGNYEVYTYCDDYELGKTSFILK